MANQEIQFEASGDNIDLIPTPNQLPPPPIIPEMVRTNAPGTFDALITQNQDLMNRLNLTLRRSLELENQVGALIERNRYLELQSQTLHSEMTQISSINKSLELEFISLRDQRDSAEALYSEFHEQANLRIQTLSDKIYRYQSYKRRIKNFVRPLLTNLKKENKAERAKREALLSENLEQKEKIERFKTQLSEAYARIQAQHTESEQKFNMLTEQYETKISFYRTENDRLNAEIADVQSKNKKLETQNQNLIEAQATFENRAILAERRYQETKATSETRTLELQAKVRELVTENTKSKVEVETLTRNIQEMNSQLNSALEEKSSLSDQYNGLQVLWDEATMQLEAAQQKVNGLQKINRELSQSLTDKRHEVEILREQLLKSQEASDQKLKSVFEMVKNSKERPQIETLDFAEEVSSAQTESLKRIKALIEDVESSVNGKSNKGDITT